MTSKAGKKDAPGKKAGKASGKRAREDRGAAARPPEQAHRAARAEASGGEAEDLNQRLLRLQADFENFRKRTMREKDSLYRRANEELLLELLPVLDHLDLALEAAAAHDTADKAMAEGLKLVAEQMQSVLGKFGLEAIDARGRTFDHNLHEAISHLPAEEPEGQVVTQVRPGYRVGDRLLRPAQVVVSSGQPTPEPGQQGPADIE